MPITIPKLQWQEFYKALQAAIPLPASSAPLHSREDPREIVQILQPFQAFLQGLARMGDLNEILFPDDAKIDIAMSQLSGLIDKPTTDETTKNYASIALALLKIGRKQTGSQAVKAHISASFGALTGKRESFTREELVRDGIQLLAEISDIDPDILPLTPAHWISVGQNVEGEDKRSSRINAAGVNQQAFLQRYGKYILAAAKKELERDLTRTSASSDSHRHARQALEMLRANALNADIKQQATEALAKNYLDPVDGNDPQRAIDCLLELGGAITLNLTPDQAFALGRHIQSANSRIQTAIISIYGISILRATAEKLTSSSDDPMAPRVMLQMLRASKIKPVSTLAAVVLTKFYLDNPGMDIMSNWEGLAADFSGIKTEHQDLTSTQNFAELSAKEYQELTLTDIKQIPESYRFTAKDLLKLYHDAVNPELTLRAADHIAEEELRQIVSPDHRPATPAPPLDHTYAALAHEATPEISSAAQYARAVLQALQKQNYKEALEKLAQISAESTQLDRGSITLNTENLETLANNTLEQPTAKTIQQWTTILLNAVLTSKISQTVLEKLFLATLPFAYKDERQNPLEQVAHPCWNAMLKHTIPSKIKPERLYELVTAGDTTATSTQQIKCLLWMLQQEIFVNALNTQQIDAILKKANPYDYQRLLQNEFSTETKIKLNNAIVRDIARYAQNPRLISSQPTIKETQEKGIVAGLRFLLSHPTFIMELETDQFKQLICSTVCPEYVEKLEETEADQNALSILLNALYNNLMTKDENDVTRRSLLPALVENLVPMLTMPNIAARLSTALLSKIVLQAYAQPKQFNLDLLVSCMETENGRVANTHDNNQFLTNILMERLRIDNTGDSAENNLILVEIARVAIKHNIQLEAPFQPIDNPSQKSKILLMLLLQHSKEFTEPQFVRLLNVYNMLNSEFRPNPLALNEIYKQFFLNRGTAELNQLLEDLKKDDFPEHMRPSLAVIRQACEVTISTPSLHESLLEFGLKEAKKALQSQDVQQQEDAAAFLEQWAYDATPENTSDRLSKLNELISTTRHLPIKPKIMLRSAKEKLEKQRPLLQRIKDRFKKPSRFIERAKKFWKTTKRLLFGIHSDEKRRRVPPSSSPGTMHMGEDEILALLANKPESLNVTHIEQLLTTGNKTLSSQEAQSLATTWQKKQKEAERVQQQARSAQTLKLEEKELKELLQQTTQLLRTGQQHKLTSEERQAVVTALTALIGVCHVYNVTQLPTAIANPAIQLTALTLTQRARLRKIANPSNGHIDHRRHIDPRPIGRIN